MSKYKLGSDDRECIKETETIIEVLLASIKRNREFKIDDYLIGFFIGNSKPQLIKSSAGVPFKYKVVHVDSNGIPYIKPLNKNGSPYGALIPTVDLDFNNDFYALSTSVLNYIQYELDPDFVDHIILGAEESYDPSMKLRKAASLRKEINTHNAENKLQTKDIADMIKIFDTVKVGEKYWTSAKTSFNIDSIGGVPWVEYHRRLAYRVKMQTIPTITITYSNGKTETLMPHQIENMNLYKKQPRSLTRELNNPI